MYKQIEKPKDNGSRAISNSTSPKKINLKSSLSFVDNRYKVAQLEPDRIDMMAGEGQLANNYQRLGIVNGLYNYAINHGILYTLTDEQKIIANLAKDTQGGFCKRFNAASDQEKKAIAKELLAKIFHNDTASQEIGPDIRAKLGRGIALSEEDENTNGPDIIASTVIGKQSEPIIESKLNSGKACVITALMFSEGGGVLGANSIEELHFILSTRFKSTWRHYSEDEVYKSLYKHLGYTMSEPPATTKLKDLNTVIGNKTHGMVSIDGGLIGFKKEGGMLYIRDNDEGLKDNPNKHTKKDKTIKAFWTK